MGSGIRRVGLVESPSNPIIRRMRDLRGPDGRREQGAFLIEGTRLVAEAVSASWDLREVLYDVDRAGIDGRLAGLLEQLPSAIPASARAIKQGSDTVTPQGILAIAAMPAPLAMIEADEPLVLVLDGLADPGNAGTILRSALAAGVRTVVALKGTVDLFAPKVVRGGMGAHFHLKLGESLSWHDLETLLGQDRMVLAAEARGDMPYHSFDWRRPTALVLGGEAHGPSRESLDRATAKVCIPLEGGVESLNAAVAGSVILFETKRQRDKEP